MRVLGRVACDTEMPTAQDTPQEIDRVYRRDARRASTTLVRLLGDFDLAEEALHEAFRATLSSNSQHMAN